MKSTVYPRTVAIAILSLVSPLSAQNFESSLPASDRAALTPVASPGTSTFVLPESEKAVGLISDDKTVITPQDSASLAGLPSTRRDVESVVDLSVLRQSSPYRTVAVSGTLASDIDADALKERLHAVTAVYRETEKSSDCPQISLSVEQHIKLDTSKALEIVETEITTNSGCACEIVKSAIKATESDIEQTVAIVETAINASPESMRIISQCAIAANPEAIAAIQELLARLDPNAGESGSSAKSAKSAKSSKGEVAAAYAPPLPDPLDLPYVFPPNPPPPIVPPPVTAVDPCH